MSEPLFIPIRKTDKQRITMKKKRLEGYYGIII